MGASAGTGLLAAHEPRTRHRGADRAPTPLRILILGGTSYIGPYQVRYAIERGHEITLFNRGRTNPQLFPGVEKLRGDRNGDLKALEGREWDAVIDNSATDPAWVRATARLLAGSVRYYMFTSSTGVYYPYLTTGIDETVEPRLVDDPETGEASSYGVQKALSELEAREAFPDGAIIVRPHYIVGPHDPKDRLTYWAVRIDRGGEVLAPGHPHDEVQFIDVRDLTEWMIRMIEDGNIGVYNATGPLSRLSTAEMVYGLRAITSTAIGFTWVDTNFLIENGIRYMVPWVAPRDEAFGMSTIDGTKAVAHGLTYRPLAVTAMDTLEWWNTLPEERRAAMAGLPAEREREVLDAWRTTPNTPSKKRRSGASSRDFGEIAVEAIDPVLL